MPPVTTDPVRARWAAGEAAFAAWLTLESPSAAGVVASAGFDAVVVDLQHGNATLGDLPSLLAAIEQRVALGRVFQRHPMAYQRSGINLASLESRRCSFPPCEEIGRAHV